MLQGERPLAKDNVTLGQFQLTGIPLAPRGIPQIEVTFDIDRNGIVNVSAKDLGTGKEQKITVTSSGGLTEADIEKMVKEAEAHAEEDKKRRELIDLKNQADTSIYAAEKTVNELGDKVSDAEKEEIEAAKEALRKAAEGEDMDEIKAKMKAMDEILHKLSQKIYEQAQASQQHAGQQGAAEGADTADDIVDAEFTEENDQK